MNRVPIQMGSSPEQSWYRRILYALAILGVIGCSVPSNRPRLIVLAVDGLDPVAIDLLISEGKLPNMARLKSEGAYGFLNSEEPRLSPILWTTIATGKYPADHGITGFAAYNEKTQMRFPVTSEMRRVKALWNIASDHDRRSAVIGWWASWPAEPIKGVVVSDHTCYHFLFPQAVDGGVTDDGLTHPPELAAEIESMILRPGDIGPGSLDRFVTVPDEELDRPFGFEDDLSHFRWVLATSESYRRIGLDLWRREVPDLLMVYLEGVDSSSHLFGHLFRSEGLAGELADQQRRFGDTVEEMYRYADEVIGEYLEAMDDDTTMVVLSDHGFVLGELHDHPGVTRDMRRVNARFHRREGVVFFAGRGIKPGSRILGAQQIDIVPTLLEILGLPVARDLPGRVLVEALEQPASERLVTTFEDRESKAETGPRGSSVDARILEHLEALGYLGDHKTGDVVTVEQAAMAFQAGRYEEAVRIYLSLIENAPDNPHLRVNLAGALGAMGRLDEALEQLETTLSLNQLLPEGYHNLARIYEKQGRRTEAIEQYRLALRYAPHFAPSQDALDRLGLTPSTTLPLDPQLRKAIELAAAAQDAAKRGDLDRANHLLDQAEELGPNLAVVHQHRSNVAYIQGDLDGALRAVERALELEPDDPLFQHNRQELLRLMERQSPAGSR
jgi:Flp pilus assembly protein TadD